MRDERDRLARVAAAHEAERNSLAQLLADVHAENVRLRLALAAATLSSSSSWPPSPNVAQVSPRPIPQQPVFACACINLICNDLYFVYFSNINQTCIKIFVD